MAWSGACSVYEPGLLQGSSDGAASAAAGTSGDESGGMGGSSAAGLGGVATSGRGGRSGGSNAGGSVSDGGQTPTHGGTTSAGGASGSAGATATGGAPPSTGGTNATGGSSGGTPPSTGGAAGGCSMNDCCPSDPEKTEPGLCGCGIADQDSGSIAGCVGVRAALAHRYTFAGSGTRVADSAGSAHGTVVNATLGNRGSLSLAGTTSNQYVDLPNGVLSSLNDATIEVWVTWSGGGNWQRIFDFGDIGGSSEGTQGVGNSYLFLTPKTGTAERCLRVAFSTTGSANETVVSGTAALDANRLAHLAVVVDGTRDRLSLYLDGAVVGTTAFTGRLSDIRDVNNWLGRAQFAADPEFAGVLHELRIYDAALTTPQVQLSHLAGPDPSFL